MAMVSSTSDAAKGLRSLRRSYSADTANGTAAMAVRANRNRSGRIGRTPP